MAHPTEAARDIVMPVQVYPMFETALRAAAGESVDEHQVQVSELWARFSAVAAKNPYAWVQRELTAEEIRTPGPSNRMIGLPYPKYMNSNNDVDMAAAVLVCSVERGPARWASPEDRWVFLHAGTDCHDTDFVSNRADVRRRRRRCGSAAARALELAGSGSTTSTWSTSTRASRRPCRPAPPALGLGLDRQLTRTGGLSFAGGPWNNYVMHAIATVVERPAGAARRATAWCGPTAAS